ncbi:MAG: hypothetical protein J7L82_06175 [Staphylothermus sp.]|nr:hypothetical protein [Staphylothermus sp.]
MTPIYIVIVDIGSDADRKRLDYLVEKYNEVYGGDKIRKICSGVLLVDLDAAKMIKFTEDIYSRFSKDRVKIWLLREPNFEVQPLELEKVFRIKREYGDIWVLVDFVMNKYHGVLVSETMRGDARTYRVKTRYGNVDVRFEKLLSPNENSGSILKVKVSGYGYGVSYFFNKIVEEFSPLER